MLRSGYPRSTRQLKSSPVKPSRDISRLIEIMAALRTPESGCPWDLEQNFRTIAPYTLEEAYEVADAIARNDLAGLGRTGRPPVASRVSCPDGTGTRRFRLRRRGRDHHQQVDPPASARFRRCRGKTAKAVKGLWERIKAEEKAERGEAAQSGALGGVPVALPALTRALKLQDKAGRVGFDWNDPRAVLAKIREEADEIEAELDRGDKVQTAAEVGDLLFAVVNLARHLDADPEGVLRETNLKFERRFSGIERALAARGKTPKDASLAEMDRLWDEAKAAEKAASAHD